MGQEIISKIDHLRKILVSYSTKGDYAFQEKDYINIRRELMINLQLKGYVPEFVRNCRDLGEFWGFIKTKFPHYYQRRSFIQEEFNPLYRVVEEKLLFESYGSASNYILLATVESSQIQAAWRKVIERSSSDPEGAITAARTLLETVCKYILEDTDVK